MITHPRGLAALCLCAMTFVTTTARAEAPAEPRTADGLFVTARGLMEAGRYPEACRKLEESYRLEAAQGTLLNLALCHEKEGRTLAALGEYRQVLSQAWRVGRTDREEAAQERIAALEASASKPATEAPVAPHPTAGESTPSTPSTSSTSSTPGTPGTPRALASRSAVAPASSHVPAAATSPVPPSPRSTRRTLATTLLVGGLAGIGAGALTAVHGGNDTTVTANVLVGLGAPLAVTGLVLLVTGPGRPAAASGAKALSPSLGVAPGVAHVGVVGVF